MPADGQGRVAVAGPPDLIVAFRACGLDTHPVRPGPEAESRVEELLRRGYHVVFFTADLAPFLARLLARHSRRALPCLTELPLASGGAGAERMRSIVKRAVGADVLGTSGEEKE